MEFVLSLFVPHLSIFWFLVFLCMFLTLSDKNQADIIEAFNSRYLDDLLKVVLKSEEILIFLLFLREATLVSMQNRYTNEVLSSSIAIQQTVLKNKG